MRLVDLTCLMEPRHSRPAAMTTETVSINMPGGPCTGVMHEFHYGSTIGTYIDFPGHIEETDNELAAADYPIELLYRMDATVIHLNRESGSGGVSADDLEYACHVRPRGGVIVVNALGARRFDAVEERSVWLEMSAVHWIVEQGATLLVSDVYEARPDLLGVFLELFDKGVSTVCCPVNLHRLDTPRARITALPLRWARAQQLPCRLIAELDG